MVASSNVARRISVRAILRLANKAGKIQAATKCSEALQIAFIFMNVFFAFSSLQCAIIAGPE
jgi:hypothetical protein